MNTQLCERIEALMLESFVNREAYEATAKKIDALGLQPQDIADYLQYNAAHESPAGDLEAERLRAIRDKETGYVDNSTAS